MTTPLPKIPADPLAAIGPRLETYWLLTADWFRTHIIELSVATVAAVLVYMALSWLRRRAARMAQDNAAGNGLLSIAARAFARTSRFFRVMAAVELVNGYANAPAPLARTIDILFTIAVVIQAAIWLREIILGLIERRAGASEGEHETLQSAMVLIRLLVSFALFAIAAIVILDNLGVNVTGLVAGLGVGGIAIGLAAQGIFSDLFAAISIIFDKPFKRGDTVTYDATTARVERIGMKSTRLRALSGEEKIISNSKLLEKEITNNTQSVYRRITFVLNIAYYVDTHLAERIPAMLREIVEANDAHFIRAGFLNFTINALDFQLVFDVSSEDVEAMFKTRHEIGIAIMKRFNEEGIEIAYPVKEPPHQVEEAKPLPKGRA